MGAQECYETWLRRVEEPSLREELARIAASPEQIEACFGQSLRFGTGGLRAQMGVGPNRLNRYVIGQAAQGYSDYLRACSARPTVAVAYDTRHASARFAMHCACVCAANGIVAYLFAEPMPTPLLSFAVRTLRCDGGVVVTASHNPPGDNGFKVYAADGAQIAPQAAQSIQAYITRVDPFDGVRACTREEALASGRLFAVPAHVRTDFLREVAGQSLLPAGVAKDFPIVYSPLNGTGMACVPKCLRENGYTRLHIPQEQQDPDGDFSTCTPPNPQAHGAMDAAVRLAQRTASPLALATDPDCDRIGVAAWGPEGMRRLTGNELGLLLAEYLLSVRKERGLLPDKPVVIRTVVTTSLVDRIAQRYGAEVRRVLTGFKYIGEQLGLLEQEGELSRFVLGLEESCGYLTGGYVRDKDGVCGALQACDLAAWHRAAGRTLPEALERLYAAYGRQEERLLSWRFCAAQGAISRAMQRLRDEGLPGAAQTDFLYADTGLPACDMLQFDYPDGARAILRPSGTEPELKLYLFAGGEDHAACQARLDGLSGLFCALLDAAPDKMM